MYSNKENAMSIVIVSKGMNILIDVTDIDLTGIRWGNDGNGYARTVDGSRIYMHRLIAGRLTDVEGLIVHHKNGNPLDNRRENLEVMTQSQHMGLHMAELSRNTDEAMLEVIETVMQADGTLTEMGEHLGLSQPMMSAIIAGKRHTRLHSQIQLLQDLYNWQPSRQRSRKK
jgi:hypothetical protein